MWGPKTRRKAKETLWDTLQLVPIRLNILITSTPVLSILHWIPSFCYYVLLYPVGAYWVSRGYPTTEYTASKLNSRIIGTCTRTNNINEWLILRNVFLSFFCNFLRNVVSLHCNKCIAAIDCERAGRHFPCAAWLDSGISLRKQVYVRLWCWPQHAYRTGKQQKCISWTCWIVGQTVHQRVMKYFQIF